VDSKKNNLEDPESFLMHGPAGQLTAILKSKELVLFFPPEDATHVVPLPSLCS
jgi:hypothetical protein